MAQSAQHNTLGIIPCFNEEQNLPGLLEEIAGPRLAESCDWVFVNDGSRDRTGELLKKSGFPTLSHERNLGYGAAVKRGLRYAHEKKYDFAAVYPGDRQRSPEDLLHLVEEIQKGSEDIIVGSKLHALKDVPLSRAWGNRFFSFWARLLWRSDYADVLSGFKVYRVGAFAPLLEELPDGYEFDIICSLLCKKHRLNVREIPVSVRYHAHSTKMRSTLGVGMKLLATSLKAWMTPRPHSVPIAGE